MLGYIIFDRGQFFFLHVLMKGLLRNLMGNMLYLYKISFTLTILQQTALLHINKKEHHQ